MVKHICHNSTTSFQARGMNFSAYYYILHQFSSFSIRKSMKPATCNNVYLRTWFKPWYPLLTCNMKSQLKNMPKLFWNWTICVSHVRATWQILYCSYTQVSCYFSHNHWACTRLIPSEYGIATLLWHAERERIQMLRKYYAHKSPQSNVF